MRWGCFFWTMGLQLLAGSAALRGEEVVLTVLPQMAPAASSVSVAVDAGLLGDALDASAISGQLTLDLLPTAMAAETAQITSLQLVLDEEMSFRLGGFLLPTVTASAAPQAISLQMVQAGQPGDLVQDEFLQLENLIAVQGPVTTSIQQEPLDLSEEPPALVDFPLVMLETRRDAVALQTSIATEVLVPLDVGFPVNISILIDGALRASGPIPPAHYEWLTPGASEGTYGEVALWHRNGVAGSGSLPMAIDRVTFHASDVQETVVDLNGSRSVASVNFVGDQKLRLANGVLQVANGQVTVDTTVQVAADAELRSAQPLRVSAVPGGAKSALWIDGQTSALTMVSGELRGAGSIASLRIEKDAVLQVLPAAETPLEVMDAWVMNGKLEILHPEQADVAVTTLLTYDSVDLSGLQAIISLDEPFAKQGVHRYNWHRQDGQFLTVVFEAQRAILESTKAVAGDTDGSGTIDFADFLRLSAAFGQAGDWTTGDFDGNGQVEFGDFLQLSTAFGGSATAAVPVPQSNVLCLLGIATISCSRRRRTARK